MQRGLAATGTPGGNTDSDEETDMHNVQPIEVAGPDKRQLPVSPNAEHLPEIVWK